MDVPRLRLSSDRAWLHNGEVSKVVNTHVMVDCCRYGQSSSWRKCCVQLAAVLFVLDVAC